MEYCMGLLGESRADPSTVSMGLCYKYFPLYIKIVDNRGAYVIIYTHFIGATIN